MYRLRCISLQDKTPKLSCYWHSKSTDMCLHSRPYDLIDTEYNLGTILPFRSLVGYNASKMLEITILSKKKKQKNTTAHSNRLHKNKGIH